MTDMTMTDSEIRSLPLHVLRVVFGILEPGTIKQMAQPTTFASIAPKLSSQPYSRWRRLQGP
jgi:hypothetical protein